MGAGLVGQRRARAFRPRAEAAVGVREVSLEPKTGGALSESHASGDQRDVLERLDAACVTSSVPPALRTTEGQHGALERLEAAPATSTAPWPAGAEQIVSALESGSEGQSVVPQARPSVWEGARIVRATGPRILTGQGAGRLAVLCGRILVQAEAHGRRFVRNGASRRASPSHVPMPFPERLRTAAVGVHAARDRAPVQRESDVGPPVSAGGSASRIPCGRQRPLRLMSA